MGGLAALDSRGVPRHGYRMEERNLFSRTGFWTLAILWLPAGVVAQAAVRFGPESVITTIATGAGSLGQVALCGLPLALGCRLIWRLGYRKAAWFAGAGLGAVTVAASILAGLLGPIAIAACAILLSLPVWIAWFWLARRR